VPDGLRGEETIAGLCRREGIAQSIYPFTSAINFIFTTSLVPTR